MRRMKKNMLQSYTMLYILYILTHYWTVIDFNALWMHLVEDSVVAIS